MLEVDFDGIQSSEDLRERLARAEAPKLGVDAAELMIEYGEGDDGDGEVKVAHSQTHFSQLSRAKWLRVLPRFRRRNGTRTGPTE